MLTAKKLLLTAAIIVLGNMISFAQILQSGSYEHLIVVNSGNDVFGIYADYQWNPNTHETELNTPFFYLYGQVKKSDTIFVEAGMPGNIKTKGYLILCKNNSIRLVIPSVDFNAAFGVYFDSGYSDVVRKMDHNYGAYYAGLGVIKDKKCLMYSSPVESSVTKGYIVANDMVYIIKRQNDWTEIEYISPNPDTKKYTRWIKSGSLYNKDPGKW